MDFYDQRGYTFGTFLRELEEAVRYGLFMTSLTDRRLRTDVNTKSVRLRVPGNRSFNTVEWEKIEETLRDKQIKFLTDYNIFTLKEMPSRVHAEVSAVIPSLIRQAIAKQIWNNTVNVLEDLMYYHNDGGISFSRHIC